MRRPTTPNMQLRSALARHVLETAGRHRRAVARHLGGSGVATTGGGRRSVDIRTPGWRLRFGWRAAPAGRAATYTRLAGVALQRQRRGARRTTVLVLRATNWLLLSRACRRGGPVLRCEGGLLWGVFAHGGWSSRLAGGEPGGGVGPPPPWSAVGGRGAPSDEWPTNSSASVGASCVMHSCGARCGAHAGGEQVAERPLAARLLSPAPAERAKATPCPLFPCARAASRRQRDRA